MIKDSLKFVISYFKNFNLQIFYEKINDFALGKMNIGRGSDVGDDGEIFVIKHISKLLNNEKEIVVFDVGANIGKYSKLLKKFFPSRTKIYSFEPSKKTFAKLKKNVGFYSNIKLINSGLSDIEKNVTLYTNIDNSGLASVYNRRLDHFNLKLDKKEVVKMTTLDKFCIKNKVNKINLLKIDVEGHEIKVLEGAKELLKCGKIDFIQFEFGGCNIDSRTFLQDFYYLFGEGYSFYRVLSNGIYKLGKYKEKYECFITTNYLVTRI